MASKTPPTLEKYQGTGFYDAAGIAGLQQQAQGYTTDAEALRQQASAAYTPTYNAQLEALRQELAQKNLASQNQLNSLGLNYDKQRRATNSQYDQSVSTALNALTKRGLGRSSAVGVTSSAIENARNQALNDIGSVETNERSGIESTMALAAQQAAQTERRLSDDYATQIEARVNELKNANQTALTNLQLQIATLQQQGYQAYLNWLQKNKKSSGGGGSSKSSGSSSKSTSSSSSTSNKLSGNDSGSSSQPSPYNFSYYFGYTGK